MRISVLGLGYVGAVVAGCLARQGHRVTGVDRETSKVELLNAGRSPIIERDIPEIIAHEVAAGRLSATTEIYTLSLHDALPISTSCAMISAMSRSMIGERPALRSSTLLVSRSTPVTLWPWRARHPATTAPT